MAVLLVGAGLVLARESRSERKGNLDRRTLPVPVLRAAPAEAYSVDVRLLGEVEAGRRSQVGFELGGRLISVQRDEGQVVKAGDLLAKLDTARLEARLREEKASLEQARATAVRAEASLQRVRRLVDKGAVSKQQLDDAIRESNVARAGVSRGEAAVDRIEVDLRNSVILAPFDGRVVGRFVDEGTILRAGDRVLELMEESAKEARFGVPAELALGLSIGDKVVVRDLARGAEWIGRLERKLAQEERLTRTEDVIVRLSSEAAVRPGELVEWRLSSTVREAGFWLPRNALTSGVRGLWVVYCAVPEPGGGDSGASGHRLERRQVEVLHVRGETVFVRGALQEDDLVVSDGLLRVVPEQSVTVRLRSAYENGQSTSGTL